MIGLVTANPKLSMFLQRNINRWMAFVLNIFAAITVQNNVRVTQKARERD
jgi:hypothetical protein